MRLIINYSLHHKFKGSLLAKTQQKQIWLFCIHSNQLHEELHGLYCPPHYSQNDFLIFVILKFIYLIFTYV